MSAKNKKQIYRNPYKEFKRCSCGRPYFYLESLKKCPKCGRKLILHQNLVNGVILGYYTYDPYRIHGKIFILIKERTFIEKIIYLGQIKREEVFRTAKQIFVYEDEVKYFDDIMIFLKIFLKELNEKYRIIKEKEKNNKLSEKDSFENLIIKRIEYNHSIYAITEFFDSFPLKSISKERMIQDLQKISCSKREIEIILHYFNHSIEETGIKLGATRERIRQIIKEVFYKLYQNTREYKEYEELEEKLKRAEEEYMAAAKRYYKSERERAKRINKNCVARI